MSANNTENNIWNKIKNLSINIYSLPNQQVHMHCNYLPISNKECYLTSNNPMFITALEATIDDSLSVERQDKYIVVKLKEKSESKNEKPEIFIQSKS